jgi:hypothetical protein
MGRPFWLTIPPPSKTRPSLAPTRFAYAIVALVVGGARGEHLAARAE